jgi:hypothetical protein
MSKGKPLIGTIKVPYEYVERLKSRAASRRVAPEVAGSSL